MHHCSPPTENKQQQNTFFSIITYYVGSPKVQLSQVEISWTNMKVQKRNYFSQIYPSDIQIILIQKSMTALARRTTIDSFLYFLITFFLIVFAGSQHWNLVAALIPVSCVLFHSRLSHRTVVKLPSSSEKLKRVSSIFSAWNGTRRGVGVGGWGVTNILILIFNEEIKMCKAKSAGFPLFLPTNFVTFPFLDNFLWEKSRFTVNCPWLAQIPWLFQVLLIADMNHEERS